MSMTEDRWRNVERLYHEARDLEPAELQRFLDEACGVDAALRAEIESLLACRREAGAFIETPAACLALRLLASRSTTTPSHDEAVTDRPPSVPWWSLWWAPVLVVCAGVLCYLILVPPPGPKPQAGRVLAYCVSSALYLSLAGLLLFRRPSDRAARWGALMFGQLGVHLLANAIAIWQIRSSPEFLRAVRLLPLPVGVVFLFGMAIAITLPLGAFGFCAVFPRPQPLRRHTWWLLWAAASTTVVIDLDWFWLPVYYRGARPPWLDSLLFVPIVCGCVYVPSAMWLLVRNYRRVESRNERRRVRIVAVGAGITFFAVTLNMVLAAPWRPIQDLVRTHWFGPLWQVVQIPFISAAGIFAAYAILRHRVFDIPVMLRLGLRYAAARGLLLSIVPAAGVVLALDLFTHGDRPLTEIAVRRGVLYLGLGAAALVLHAQRRRWLDGLDRRFFRERYDAQRILGAVVDNIRRASRFDAAAREVIERVDAALHPESVSLMVREPGADAYRSAAAIGAVPPPIAAGAKLVGLVRLLNKPIENSQSGTSWLQEELPREEADFLRRARVEWLFPVSLGGPTEAILLLGPKRSEEPYSREDRELLDAIAGNLALLLERAETRGQWSGFAECPTCGNCYEAGRQACEKDADTLVKSPYPRMLAERYRLERRLGQGGMAAVYEGFDRELERRVAVKVMRPEWLASAEAVARFRNEARAAAALSHPNVVTVFDFGVAEDGRSYLVMELLAGRNLREELVARSAIPAVDALRILRNVCSAVAVAHERDLLHRDLKPENVFLARLQTGDTTKILDFGLAKPLLSTVTPNAVHTAAGALIGTLPYMSPEQLRGGMPAASWDLWAIAVIAFEVVAGAHPFGLSGVSPAQLLERQEQAVWRDVPGRTGESSRFFERALAVDPGRRPSTVEQLFDEFAAAVSPHV